MLPELKRKNNLKAEEIDIMFKKYKEDFKKDVGIETEPPSWTDDERLQFIKYCIKKGITFTYGF